MNEVLRKVTAFSPIKGVAVLLLGAMCSCQQQQQFVRGGSIGVRDHADSVVHLGQVDPAYRSYFSEQHGKNYSIADQRKAFFEAVRTSRTPVNQDARHAPRNASPKKKTSAKPKKRSTRKTTKKTARKKSTAKRRKR